MTTDLQPAQYTMQQVKTLLSYSHQTIYRLVEAGILVKHGHGQHARYSAAAITALLEHLAAGGELWDAPRQTNRVARPVPVAPVVKARSTVIKTGNGGPRSINTANKSAFAVFRRKTHETDSES